MVARGQSVRRHMVHLPDPVCAVKGRNGNRCNLGRYRIFLVPRYLASEGSSGCLWEHKSVGLLEVKG